MNDKFCPQCGIYHWKYQQLAMDNDIISIQECKCGWMEERTDWEAIRKDSEKIELAAHYRLLYGASGRPGTYLRRELPTKRYIGSFRV